MTKIIFGFAQCWKTKTLLIEKKYFMKWTTYLVISLVKQLLSQNFCQKNERVNFHNFHTTLWKLRNFTATVFSQKFRQINVLLKKLFYKLIWRKKITWRSEFLVFSTLCSTQCGKTKNSLPHNFFPSNQFIVNFFSKTLIRRNFCE